MSGVVSVFQKQPDLLYIRTFVNDLYYPNKDIVNNDRSVLDSSFILY